jgi:hypothetical protein
MEISEELLEKIGDVIDQMDNYVAATELPMKTEFHLDMLKNGIIDWSEELKNIYQNISGDEVWYKFDEGED